MEIAGLIIKCSFAVIIGVCALVFLIAFIQTTIEKFSRNKKREKARQNLVDLLKIAGISEEFANEDEKKEQKKEKTTKKSTTKKKEEK